MVVGIAARRLFDERNHQLVADQPPALDRRLGLEPSGRAGGNLGA